MTRVWVLKGWGVGVKWWIKYCIDQIEGRHPPFERGSSVFCTAVSFSNVYWRCTPWTPIYFCMGWVRLITFSYWNTLLKERKLTLLLAQKSLWQLCSLPTVSHLPPWQHGHHLTIGKNLTSFLIYPTQTAQNIGEYIDKNRVVPLFDYRYSCTQVKISLADRWTEVSSQN